MSGNRSVNFNEQQMQEIERLALLNCNSNTISEVVGVAVNTLKRHCGRKLRHWRALYRVNLRENQAKLSETSPDLVKFLGKNELGQVDKQGIETKRIEPKPLTTEQIEDYRAAADLIESRQAERARKGLKVHQEAG